MKFKPEDFNITSLTVYAAADIANAKLKEWLDQAQVVYGVKDDKTGWVFGRGAKHDTHKALVICIEELVKESCKHEPLEVTAEVGKFTTSVTFDYSSNSKCKHCGVELIAKWKEKK